VASAALRDELSALAAREGVTVFLTTHNLAEAEKLCQQVGVIRKGKLQALGAPDQLRAQTGHPHIEISGTGFTPAAIAALQARPEVGEVQRHNGHLIISLRQAAEAAPLVSLLVAQGGQVEEVKKGAADLEEVFLTLMEEEAKA
jgi:ABC-2 type transport system ATP-binding protein